MKTHKFHVMRSHKVTVVFRHLFRIESNLIKKSCCRPKSHTTNGQKTFCATEIFYIDPLNIINFSFLHT